MPRTAKWKKNTLGLVIAILLPLSLGGIGAVTSNYSLSTWYRTLRKPSWNPPNWVFGPVWTALYIMMGLASWLVWRERTSRRPSVEEALRWYSIQLFFNGLWSIIFFGMRRIRLALVDIVALWGSLLVTLIQFFRVRKIAAWLLIPYFLWVSFATMLNAMIWWLNRNR
jgi:tryptophan-rich sensory protein